VAALALVEEAAAVQGLEHREVAGLEVLAL
jgi:hypothetical protein